MKDDLAKKIGARIRSKRKKSGISQKGLAESVDITAAAINQFEKGEKKPSAGVLAKIAHALDFSTDYLLGEADDEGIFISNDVVTTFRDFKNLSKKDREIIMRNIEFLKSEAKNKE